MTTERLAANQANVRQSLGLFARARASWGEDTLKNRET
jgi:hypothetical protein